jgi:S1-C subfamily serine protease
MTEIVQFAAGVARRIAELPQRPTFQRVAEETGERRGFKVRTGVIPEFGWEGVGFKISGVRGGSAADKAGLKAGDVVVRFGPREIRNIYDYMYALGDHKAGEEVPVTVQRDGKEVTFAVTLEAGGPAGR